MDMILSWTQDATGELGTPHSTSVLPTHLSIKPTTLSRSEDAPDWKWAVETVFSEVKPNLGFERQPLSSVLPEV